MNNSLEARANKVREQAKYEPERRLVSGTEPKPIQTEHRPIANGQRNRDTGKSCLDSIRESFNE